MRLWADDAGNIPDGDPDPMPIPPHHNVAMLCIALPIPACPALHCIPHPHIELRAELHPCRGGRRLHMGYIFTNAPSFFVRLLSHCRACILSAASERARRPSVCCSLACLDISESSVVTFNPKPASRDPIFEAIVIELWHVGYCLTGIIFVCIMYTIQSHPFPFRRSNRLSPFHSV